MSEDEGSCLVSESFWTKTPADALGTAVSARCMATGLSCNVVQLKEMGGTFRIAPPLTIVDAEIEEGIQIMDAAFQYVLGLPKFNSTALA